MNTTILRKLLVLAAIGLFSQFATAQGDANGLAVKQIADIVVGLNHFPSDADIATLIGIIADGELAQGVRDMANTVANIEHSANEEGRGAMEAIQANSQAPDRAKVLAGMIISALSWEDAHGIQGDRDKNDKDVTGPRPAGVSCPPRFGPSPDRDGRVGQGGDGDGIPGPASDVRRPARPKG